MDRSFRVAAVALAVVLLTPACRDHDRGTPSGTTADPPVPPAPVGTPTGIDPGCSANQPTALEVAPETAFDRFFVDKFVACTDAQHVETRLTNNTDMVWQVRRTDGVALSTSLSGDPLSDLFTDYTARHPADGVSPGRLALEPHTTMVVSSRPELLSWSPATMATAAWQVHSQLVKSSQKFLTKGLAATLTDDPTERDRYYQCLSFGLSVAQEADSSGQEVTTGHLLQGLHQARSWIRCLAAMGSAEDASVAPAVIDDAAQSLQEPLIRSRIDDLLHSAKAIELKDWLKVLLRER